MAAKVFVALSHKGGTGRSVTIANVAYRLARSGQNVCCLDLDLASPTFGSVLGLAELETGAERGVHDVLRGDVEAQRATELLHNVWANKRISAGGYAGQFKLLPGNRDAYEGLEWNGANLRNLRDLLVTLRTSFDYILADLRSGVSLVAGAFDQPEFADIVAGWIILHRWTPQHLAGTSDLLETLQAQDREILLVRTAQVDPASYPPKQQGVFLKVDAELERRYRDLVRATTGARAIGVVPLEPLLQWREQIITDDDVAKGLASKGIVESFDSIARALMDCST